MTVVEHTSENSVRKELRSQLAELKSAGDNWDGYGSEAAKQSALEAAECVIDHWNAPASVVVEVSLLSDGCVSFEFYDVEGDLLGVLDVLGEAGVSFALSVNALADVCGQFSLEGHVGLNRFFENLKRAVEARG